ncbi:MAG: IMP cyclohydrolase [Deltaproteobacteria bacterium]|nr:IMP cyclohydrolase [Deltaproteobacteria bacterium]
MNDLRKMYQTIQDDPFPQDLTITLGDQTLVFRKRSWNIDGQTKGLRYGENPDQSAALYELKRGTLTLAGRTFRGPSSGLVSSLGETHMLQAGKHPGKTNLTDVDNGINILQYLAAKPAVVILKHNNPCGAAWSDEGPEEALRKAFFADRIAAFGGAVVTNSPITISWAEFATSQYLEVVAAPAYEAGALDILKRKKNLRILEIPNLADLSFLTETPFLDLKSLCDGGLVAQFSFQNRIRTPADFLPARADKDGQTIIARSPDPREAEDLLFAWAVEAGVTSNSVIFVRDGATVAIGTGEQDRVGCVDITIRKAHTKFADILAFERHGLSIYQLRQQAENDEAMHRSLQDIEDETSSAFGGIPGSVLVSDGFFPFRDGVDLAVSQGVTAIAQPGGSIRDFEVIQAVNQADPQVAMTFTGQRSFRH